MTRPQLTALILGSVLLLAGATWYLKSQKRPTENASSPVPALTPQAKHAFTNRLIHSKSPYLLQHAHNPVDWYEWGQEAFDKARRENKPIFLSVGYSTCHWCHVMERESFENEDIAKLMNEHFVCVKVDREERPDVDRVYMTFVQATTGSGGWPLNVWLTPDLQPILGGTYFPPEDQFGRRGFPSMLKAVARAWEAERDGILAASSNITRQLQAFAMTASTNGTALDAALLDAGYEQIKAGYEPRHGGFGNAPKFPRPVTLNFMLRYHVKTGTNDAREMALFTLRKMADGGMHDHLGGGFHRYSVDERWHVPHFEKMLYDQAQLACSYLEAYQLTRDEIFAAIARDTLDYVLRNLTGPRGQFYSAEDADSARPEAPDTHAEGAFYVWEAGEIETALGADVAAIFNHHYGVEPRGNVRDDPHDEFPNKNVLIVSHTLEETARKFGRSTAAVQTLLAEAREKLFQVRAKRPRPHLDDKTLTAWNGLMISAFARAHQVLEEPRYLKAARDAAAFIRAELHQKNTGQLLRRHRAGESAIGGFLDDYAFFIQGLLDLYEAGFDVAHLQWALELQRTQDALFWDAEGKGYFSTTGNDPSILVRMKEDYDGAEPSPNSIAALNLLRLAEMTDNSGFRERAAATIEAFSTRLRRGPAAMPQMLVSLDFQLSKPRQIIIAGTPDRADTRALLQTVHHGFMPKKILLLADGGVGQRALARHLEFIEEIRPLDGAATAYVCENYACQLPTTNLTVLARQLGRTP